MHKITNLWKFELNRLSKLRDNNERKKHPCHTKLCAFRWLISRPQILTLRSQNQICGNYFFLENYVTSEGAVSHNVLLWQLNICIRIMKVHTFRIEFVLSCCANCALEFWRLIPREIVKPGSYVLFPRMLRAKLIFLRHKWTNKAYEKINRASVLYQYVIV